MGSSTAETMSHDHQGKDTSDGTNRNTVHGEEAHSNYNRRDPLKILDQVKIENTIESPMPSIRSVFTDSKEEGSSFSKEGLRKVEEQLKLVFIEFYQKLLHLKDYRW